MGEKPDVPDRKRPPEPPPFNPDPELIAFLEHGGKPGEEEVREMAKKAETRSTRDRA